MGTKETISNSYIEEWHEKTKHWTLPGERRAVVIGSDGSTNIGNAIADALRDELNPFLVSEYDKDNFNLIEPFAVKHFPWRNYDTAVFANGYTHLDWIEDQSPDQISRVINDKLLATMYGVKAFVRHTKEREVKKSIVVIGSMAASSVLNGSSIYCAACAGLQHFVRCIAWELAPKGYQVFLINPSNVEGTPMTEATIEGLMDYRHMSREDAEAYWSATRALPRWLNREDIGSIVSWLVTDSSAEWLSGVPLNLGGGLR